MFFWCRIRNTRCGAEKIFSCISRPCNTIPHQLCVLYLFILCRCWRRSFSPNTLLIFQANSVEAELALSSVNLGKIKKVEHSISVWLPELHGRAEGECSCLQGTLLCSESSLDRALTPSICTVWQNAVCWQGRSFSICFAGKLTATLLGTGFGFPIANLNLIDLRPH